MHRIWPHLLQRRSELDRHPFFVGLSSEVVPLERRFSFSPVMIDFIMGFADMNKWFLSYSNPVSEYERAINEHTEEDRTHSRLFYEEWFELELAGAEFWGPGKMLWWLFHSEESKVVRHFGMKIIDLSVNHPDPLIRFCMIEAIEVCGDVFFSHTAPIAQELAARSGQAHRYYGEYHRVRESGHLQADESAFARAALNDEQASACLLCIDTVFDNFLRVLDQLQRYSERAVVAPLVLQNELARERRRFLASPPLKQQAPASERWFDETTSPSQATIVQMLREGLEDLRTQPLLEWLKRDETISAMEKLQAFVALWGVDIVGYRDFNELALMYPSPRNDLARAINAWATQLASHATLYLQDWNALNLDEVLGWNAGETFAFYFLGEETEIHRKNMAQVKHYAFGHRKPVVRWWLMFALEQAGEVLFEATAPVARMAERENDVTLNYWTNRHYLTHSVASSDCRSLFLQLDISTAESDLISAIIKTVLGNMRQQFQLSHAVATNYTIAQKPRSLPPPRFSTIVPAGNDAVASNVHRVAEDRQLSRTRGQSSL